MGRTRKEDSHARMARTEADDKGNCSQTVKYTELGNCRGAETHKKASGNEFSKGNVPQIHGRDTSSDACPAEAALVKNPNVVTPYSFEFHVGSEDGINLYVDLNSSPSYWTRRLNEVCNDPMMHDSKSRSFHEELRQLRDGNKEEKSSSYPSNKQSGPQVNNGHLIDTPNSLEIVLDVGPYDKCKLSQDSPGTHPSAEKLERNDPAIERESSQFKNTLEKTSVRSDVSEPNKGSKRKRNSDVFSTPDMRTLRSSKRPRQSGRLTPKDACEKISLKSIDSKPNEGLQRKRLLNGDSEGDPHGSSNPGGSKNLRSGKHLSSHSNSIRPVSKDACEKISLKSIDSKLEEGFQRKRLLNGDNEGDPHGSSNPESKNLRSGNHLSSHSNSIRPVSKESNDPDIERESSQLEIAFEITPVRSDVSEPDKGFERKRRNSDCTNHDGSSTPNERLLRSSKRPRRSGRLTPK